MVGRGGGEIFFKLTQYGIDGRGKGGKKRGETVICIGCAFLFSKGGKKEGSGPFRRFFAKRRGGIKKKCCGFKYLYSDVGGRRGTTIVYKL